MKYALIHTETGVIVSLASNPANLNSSYGTKLGLPDNGYHSQEAPKGVKVGDLIDGTPKPENRVSAFRSYAEKRAAEYPPIGDQLDEMWKIIDAANVAAGNSMLAAVKAVKAKYPK